MFMASIVQVTLTEIDECSSATPNLGDKFLQATDSVFVRQEHCWSDVKSIVTIIQ